jgi:predicted O-linked N-acetylglucosamine transferase (SPINDLY family)
MYSSNLHCPRLLHLHRGRFTLGIYREMNITDLVASSPAHYVAIALKLVRDDAFWLAQAATINERFVPFAQSNNLRVAREWAEFMVSALR